MFDVVWPLAEYDKRIKQKHKCPSVRQYKSGQNSLNGSSKNFKKELESP
jgi:hypothetical protein